MSPHPAAIDHPTAAAEQPERITTGTPGAGPVADSQRPLPSRRRWRMRCLIAVSLFVGVTGAVTGVVATSGGTEPVVDAAVLLGFASGWALLAVLSTLFTDHPQRWAAVPAVTMGLGAAALLIWTPSATALDAAGWIWPPALLALLTWIVVRIRRELPAASGRWMLYPVIAVTSVAAVGGGVHTVSQAIDELPGNSASGQLFDVGDHQMYLSCNGSGEPTVILEPGLGETSAAWGWIAPTVATHTRVCVYDRAGRGRSEPAATAPDGDQIGTDLHAVLERAGVSGPLVLVGHSLGGLYVLDYTRRYPDQVAGMVLVDATPPSAFTTVPTYPGFYDIYRTATGLFPGLARIGVTRLVNAFGHDDLPADARDQARADLSTAGQARSERDELAMVPTMMAQAGSLTDLGDLPLYVLTAPLDAEPGWLTPQMDLAALSSNSVHLVVAGASHPSLLDRQSDAAVVGAAITEVVRAARSDAPLIDSLG